MRNFEALDLTIGLSHIQHKYRYALTLDRIEPSRPVVDEVVLELLLKDSLTREDFTITNDGFSRLNPQFARRIVQSAFVV